MNIEEHKFYDDDLSYCHSTDGEVYFDFSNGGGVVMVSKVDVVALSEHFELSKSLKQHDIALLNKLRNKFINSDHSCEHELLDMINSLELEK